MKRITSVILAIALIFALAVTAMAAEIADCTCLLYTSDAADD